MPEILFCDTLGSSVEYHLQKSYELLFLILPLFHFELISKDGMLVAFSLFLLYIDS